jgi:hypothetical protein
VKEKRGKADEATERAKWVSVFQLEYDKGGYEGYYDGGERKGED